MTYCQVVDVTGPVEMYDATHTELVRRTTGRVQGLIVHLCRPTVGGFQIVEVWSTRDDCERAERDLVGPILASMSAPPPDGSEGPALPRVEEFAVRGLIIPAGGTVI